MFVTCNGRWQQHSQRLLSAGTIRCSCLADVHLALMRVAGFFYSGSAASTRTLSHRIEIVTMMSNRWRHVASIEFKSNISKNNNLNKLNECEIFPTKTDDNNQKDHSHHNSINSCQCYSSHIKRAVDWADIFFVFESLISQNFGLSYNERCYGFVEIHLIVCWMGSKFRVNWLALFISRGSDADGDDHKIQTQFYWIWLHILYAYEYECIWCLHCTRGRYWLMALLHIQIAYTQHNKIITRRRARALVLKLACLAAQQPHNANDCCIFGSIILLLSLLLLHYVWWLLWPFCMPPNEQIATNCSNA